MRVFIVHAHHEPSSFNTALTREARESLRAANHEVVVSDLYAMGFDPVSDRRNFLTVKDSSRLKQQVEEEHASAHDGYAADLQTEMDKLAWCEALILQFPLWWLGMPAIMKGWVDRVFALGRTYGGGRFYSRGLLSGKRAMCSVTIGGPERAYRDNGLYGSIENVLFPIHHGILGFVGFKVIEPHVVYAPARMTAAERELALLRYRDRVLNLQGAPTLPIVDANRYRDFVRVEEAN